MPARNHWAGETPATTTTAAVPPFALTKRKFHTWNPTRPFIRYLLLSNFRDQLPRQTFLHRPAASSITSINQPRWVVFTARARAFQPPPSPTPALLPRGSRPPPSRSSTRSASWPRRVPLPPRSVLSCVTPTVSPRSRSSLVSFSGRREGGFLEENGLQTGEHCG